MNVTTTAAVERDKLTSGLKDMLEEGNRQLKLVHPNTLKVINAALERLGGEKLLELLELMGIECPVEVRALLEQDPNMAALARTDRGQASIRKWKQQHKGEIQHCRDVLSAMAAISRTSGPMEIPGEVENTEAWIGKMAWALRHLHDRSALNRSSLARLDAVEKLAREKYQSHLMPRGLALREILLNCVAEAIKEAQAEPGLTKVARYLELMIEGFTCKEISKEIHLTREHVSRTYRRKALELVADHFRLRIRNAN